MVDRHRNWIKYRSGGIGRHARFRGVCRKTWGFESLLRYSPQFFVSQDMRVRPDGYRDPPSVLLWISPQFFVSQDMRVRPDGYRDPRSVLRDLLPQFFFKLSAPMLSGSKNARFTGVYRRIMSVRPEKLFNALRSYPAPFEFYRFLSSFVSLRIISPRDSETASSTA